MKRITDRLQTLERAARSVNGELVVIECAEQPTAGQIGDWEAANKAGRRLFVVGPGLDWGWMPSAGLGYPWEPLS